MPKVSVIIPAYNAMKYLPETLESVLRQTFIDFEVLIINDGSSDNIVQWVSELIDPRVKLISQVNQGLSAARNTGIANAQADYIAFLDADDLWEPTKLEKQVNYLDSNSEIGLIHTWIALVDEQGKSTGRVIKSDIQGNVWEKMIQSNGVACLSVMVRRCCFETVGNFDTNLRSIEDWDMWIRIATRYPFAVINEPLAYYRQVSNSMSKNCRVMSQAFQMVIEKSFKSAPSELLYLKNRSYGYANICLAWKALQSRDRDYKLAMHYCEQAISFYPKLRYSYEYLRLNLAMRTLQILGNNRYSGFINFVYNLRRQLLRLTFQ